MKEKYLSVELEVIVLNCADILLLSKESSLKPGDDELPIIPINGNF